MSERPDPHAADAVVGDRGKPDDPEDDPGAGHGDDMHGAGGDGAHGDGGHGDGGHGAEALGPIDVQAWGAAVIGVALGLVVVLAFVLGGG